MKKRIWYDGSGNKMKPGSYSQNEVKFINNICEHKFENKIVEIFFFAGGYYLKMRKCKKCGRYASDNMIKSHPTAQHRFTILTSDGYRKCRDCGLKMSLLPVMNISRKIYF